MKKVFCLVAALLLLLTTPWDVAFSRQNPIDYHEAHRDNGDDHPWGGENELNPDDDPIGLTSTSPGINPVSSFWQVDVWMWRIIVPIWIDIYEPVDPGSTTNTNSLEEGIVTQETTNPASQSHGSGK